MAKQAKQHASSSKGHKTRIWVPWAVLICMPMTIYIFSHTLSCSVQHTSSSSQTAPPIQLMANSHFNSSATIPSGRAGVGALVSNAQATQRCIPDVSARTEYVLPDVAREVARAEKEGTCKGKKVIAVSLYGDNPRYTTGAVENAWLAKRDWPDWTYRVYYGEGVPADVLDFIQRMGGELVPMTAHRTPQNNVSSTSWRFLALTDNTATRVICRDADARLTARDKAAVQEWEASKWLFHTMHDHKNHHKWPVLAGLFGSVGGLLHPRLIQELFSPAVLQRNNTWYADQAWLKQRVWPLVRNVTLEHASFHCGKFRAAETRGFPTQALTKFDFVGNVYRPGKWHGEFAVGKACPITCRRKPEWDSC